MLDGVRNWDFKIYATLVAHCSLLDSSLDSFGPCAEQRKRPDDAEDSVYEGNPIDVRFPSSGIADVGIIWDTSIYSFRDTYYLKQVRRVAFKSYVPSSHPPFYHCMYRQAGHGFRYSKLLSGLLEICSRGWRNFQIKINLDQISRPDAPPCSRSPQLS